VAVADFPDLQNVTSDLGRYIASRLTTRLVQSPKFFVIERQRLSQVLAELNFSMSDLVDPAKAKRLGQMVGVEAIVVGTVSDLGNQVDLDARMIEIETNRMLLGATVTISKDPTVEDMLKRGRQETVATTPPVPPGSASGAAPAARPAPKPVATAEVEGIALELRECRITGPGIECEFTVRNNAEHMISPHFAVDGSQTYLIDDLGNKITPTALHIGTLILREGSGGGHQVPPGMPMRMSATFRAVPSGSRTINVILGLIPSGDKYFGVWKQAVFRNIPLLR
jgi:TolB-like protein